MALVPRMGRPKTCNTKSILLVTGDDVSCSLVPSMTPGITRHPPTFEVLCLWLKLSTFLEMTLEALGCVLLHFNGKKSLQYAQPLNEAIDSIMNLILPTVEIGIQYKSHVLRIPTF